MLLHRVRSRDLACGRVARDRGRGSENAVCGGSRSIFREGPRALARVESLWHHARPLSLTARAMTEFLSAILSVPTVVFTVLLLVIILYWLMVIVGAIGVDI
jgi:hypothetical protein